MIPGTFKNNFRFLNQIFHRRIKTFFFPCVPILYSSLHDHVIKFIMLYFYKRLRVTKMEQSLQVNGVVEEVRACVIGKKISQEIIMSHNFLRYIYWYLLLRS